MWTKGKSYSGWKCRWGCRNSTFHSLRRLLLLIHIGRLERNKLSHFLHLYRNRRHRRTEQIVGFAWMKTRRKSHLSVWKSSMLCTRRSVNQDRERGEKSIFYYEDSVCVCWALSSLDCRIQGFADSHRWSVSENRVEGKSFSFDFFCLTIPPSPSSSSGSNYAPATFKLRFSFTNFPAML